ncbi:TRAP transporter permease [Streptomyces tirandamycinicus]|uniref:TRAP transporter permease n=1 Tax=Streptomyces tirandamycinicus TaxID=2174846 RepID=UPI0022706184|nr:TRAP transporter fused permease subunit [Streptomyces tirandamycinicus]MCY0982093.1 TRAP transporter fused permease subunit [Streptomyces tirandamycinicus]
MSMATAPSEPRQRTAEELAAEFDQERPARKLSQRVSGAVSLVCAAVSVFVLYSIFLPPAKGTQYYLTIFLAATLPLVFVTYRGTVKVPAVPLPWRRGARAQGETGDRPARRDDPGSFDWLLAAAALAVCLYPLLEFDPFIERRQLPTSLDVLAGLVLIVLVLEACRRTTGWVLPAFCAAFLFYAYYGGLLPYDWSLAHGGFDIDAIAAHFFMGTDGVYGVPLNVAGTYIVLFTIFGAVLDISGAGKFFIDLSFAAFRGSRSAPGRTVTTAGFLLGTVSGSGTATAVSLGSVAWPVLRRAGYGKEQGGGVLAAAGIGAILSPPTLGAAAFIIAEYLRESYLTVLLYALVPTLLYYLGILLAVEIDARKHQAQPVVGEKGTSALRLLGRFGYHFLSLFMIVGFMAAGLPPFKAVVYATVLQFLLSFLDPEHRMTPRRLYAALAEGCHSVLPVVATCAAAGIIVAVVTQTGLGLNLASVIVDAAGLFGDDKTVKLILTAVFAAVAVSILGLAVPVTASFIIAAVIIAPALLSLGIATHEAYMFIFYYAVLSEVSPPTALAAAAAAAITGGNPMRTMVATWKYSLPAFLVPFAFVLTDNGSQLLGTGSLAGIAWTTAVSALAVAALAAATGGWLIGPAGRTERALCAAAALCLLYLEPAAITAGVVALALAFGVHRLRRRQQTPAVPTTGENRPADTLMEGHLPS